MKNSVLLAGLVGAGFGAAYATMVNQKIVNRKIEKGLIRNDDSFVPFWEGVIRGSAMGFSLSAFLAHYFNDSPYIQTAVPLIGCAAGGFISLPGWYYARKEEEKKN